MKLWIIQMDLCTHYSVFSNGNILQNYTTISQTAFDIDAIFWSYFLFIKINYLIIVLGKSRYPNSGQHSTSCESTSLLVSPHSCFCSRWEIFCLTFVCLMSWPKCISVIMADSMVVTITALIIRIKWPIYTLKDHVERLKFSKLYSDMIWICELTLIADQFQL